jgi:hypothetical protein
LYSASENWLNLPKITARKTAIPDLETKSFCGEKLEAVFGSGIRGREYAAHSRHTIYLANSIEQSP